MEWINQKEMAIVQDISSKVDLYLIIAETALDKLKTKVKDEVLIRKLAKAIFNMIGFVNFTMGHKYFAL
jgi:hypothetical protein